MAFQMGMPDHQRDVGVAIEVRKLLAITATLAEVVPIGRW